MYLKVAKLLILIQISIMLSTQTLLAEEFSAPHQGATAHIEATQEQKMQARTFKWWPTDARPGPVLDKEKGGYWWWPEEPGHARPWGNRGYIYVRKIIFDYKADELPPPKPNELRPALLVKKIIQNVKVYFDFDGATLRDDAIPILNRAVRSLERNREASVLITGNTDVRGSESYNEKLGAKRAQATKEYFISQGVDDERIKIISRGKLDALAPVTDIVGMQKDRNAQFMVAIVEELMIPYPEDAEMASGMQPIEENKFLAIEEKNLESEIKVSTKEYVIKKTDSLWKIAKREYGDGNQWKRLYSFNKDKIKDPNRLRPGTKIQIPIE